MKKKIIMRQKVMIVNVFLLSIFSLSFVHSQSKDDYLILNKILKESNYSQKDSLKFQLKSSNALGVIFFKKRNTINYTFKHIYDKETNLKKEDSGYYKSLGNSFGYTTLPDANDLIRLQINNDSGFWGVDYQPNLLVAQTIFHEIIHAEFYRQLIEAIGAGVYGTTTTDIEIIEAMENPSPNYYVIYDHFRNYKNWSHAYMANYYREAIAAALQEFDTGVYPNNNLNIQEQYLLLAWKGLRWNDIQAWNSLSTIQQGNINTTINNYTASNANENCN